MKYRFANNLVVILWDKKKDTLASALDFEKLKQDKLWDFFMSFENKEIVSYVFLDDKVTEFEIRVCANNVPARTPTNDEIVTI